MWQQGHVTSLLVKTGLRVEILEALPVRSKHCLIHALSDVPEEFSDFRPTVEVLQTWQVESGRQKNTLHLEARSGTT